MSAHLIRFLGGPSNQQTTWIDILPAAVELPIWQDAPDGKTSSCVGMAVYEKTGEEGAEGEVIYRYRETIDPPEFGFSDD